MNLIALIVYWKPNKCPRRLSKALCFQHQFHVIYHKHLLDRGLVLKVLLN